MLALVASTALLTEIGLNSRNTLDHHPEWFLGKGLMQRVPVGTGETRIYRNLLAGNRLNLGVFHGFQEVLYVRPLVLGGASFRFCLEPGAYLDVLLRKTRDGASGVRLAEQCFYWRADERGGFLAHTPLRLTVGPGWHRCQLGPEFLTVDGASVDLPVSQPAPGLFGFRGSLANVQVDDVELWESGRKVFTESFRNDRHLGAVALECFGLLFVLSALVFLLSRRERLLRTVAFLLAAVVVLALYWACDYYVLGRAYLSYYRLEQLRQRVVQRLFGGADPLPAQDLQETLRFLAAPQEARPSDYRLTAHREGQTFLFPDTAEAIAQYRREHPQPRTCVLFLGTSQTWGEGAYRLNETLVRYCGDALPDGVETINAARRGSNSVELVHRYFDHLYHLKPDLIVVNLGNNDLDAKVLADSLRKLAHLPVLVVLEANSPEAPSAELKAKHEAMRATGLKCVDLHGHLAEDRSGLLWWDKVHLTSYGQEVAGGFLAQQIRSLAILPR